MTRNIDSELSPAKRPRCPRCEVRMITNGVSERPDGAKHCVFECLECGHIENNAVASDPLSNAEGRLSGEVGRRAVTYEIKEGRLVPKIKPK
jgi:RNase P subunit RPR2